MNRLYLFLFLALSFNRAFGQPLGDRHAIVYALDIQPENQLLAALIGRDRVEIWDYNRKDLVKTFPLNAKGADVAFGDSFIAIAKADGFIEIYSIHNFEKQVDVNVSSNSLVNILPVGQKGMIVTDAKGNVFLSDTIDSKLNFKKLFTSSNPIDGIEVFPAKHLILTSCGGEEIYFWSLSDGKLLSQQNLGKNKSIVLKSNEEKTKIFITKKNQAIQCDFSKNDLSIQETDEFSLGGWPMAIDFTNKMTVVGTANGKIRIFGQVRYKKKLPVMINSVHILREYSPNIMLVIGTHGGGIQLLKGTDMGLIK